MLKFTRRATPNKNLSLTQRLRYKAMAIVEFPTTSKIIRIMPKFRVVEEID